MKTLKISLLPVLLWIVFIVHPLYAQQAPALQTPDRICLTVTQAPDQRQAVSWRTQGNGTANAEAQLHLLEDFIHHRGTARTLAAETVSQKLPGRGTVYYHSAVFDRLLPDTWYAYRVGSDAQWSEWNRFRTASNTSAPFSFAFFGDVQNDIAATAPIVFQTAAMTLPDARFWMFAGDMVNEGRDDSQWEAFFGALGRMGRVRSIVPVAGNHEYPNPRVVPWEKRTLTPLWHAQFRLPGNGPEGLEGSAYWFTYGNVLFAILNGNEKLAEQAQWLAAVLEKNRQPWVIAAIHQPAYSVSRKRNNTRYQEIFVPLFDRFGVDLVLQGHGHAYTRTFPLKNHRPARPGQKGTVYLMSVAGPKTYPVHHRYANLFAKTAHGRQWFHSISIDPGRIRVTTYNLAGAVEDRFEIIRP